MSVRGEVRPKQVRMSTRRGRAKCEDVEFHPHPLTRFLLSSGRRDDRPAALPPPLTATLSRWLRMMAEADRCTPPGCLGLMI